MADVTGVGGPKIPERPEQPKTAQGAQAAKIEINDKAVTLTKMEKNMQNTPSLSASDESSKSVQKTPWRVSLEAMKRRVTDVEYIRPHIIPHVTICIVVLDNGYALQGMSAPADPENFNEEKGREFAFEDAMRKMWPLEAYVMREMMSGNAEVRDADTRWAE